MLFSLLKDVANQLVFDRTQADVDYALILERSGLYTDDNIKGAYNISDRNRVGEAVNYIAGALAYFGIFESRAGVLREDWDRHDIIKPRDNARVLTSLDLLKWLLPFNKTAAVPESLDILTYQKANAIESIIFDSYNVLLRLWDSWLWPGDGYASDFDALNWQGWDDCN